MVERIVKRFAPEKIILFGSHASESAGPDSDVDLLGVMTPTHDTESLESHAGARYPQWLAKAANDLLTATQSEGGA